MTSNRARDLFLTFRPWSFTVTLVPFLLAAALIFPDEQYRNLMGFVRWGVGLFSGIMFHATVNLLNTWGDERSGLDATLGAFQTTPQVRSGAVSLSMVLGLGIASAVLSIVSGLALAFYRVDGQWFVSWSLLALGVVGFLGVINYTTLLKIKYWGFGVPLSALLMGPLEIAAAIVLVNPVNYDIMLKKWLADVFSSNIDMRMLFHSGKMIVGYLICTSPIAFLVGAIMHGNDMRDVATDRLAHIRTFAMAIGPKLSLGYYFLSHIVPYVVVAGHFLVTGFYLWALPFLALPLTISTLKSATVTYSKNPKQPHWIGLERISGKIHFVFGVLYALTVALILLFHKF